MVDAKGATDDISQGIRLRPDPQPNSHQRGERHPHGQGPKDQGHVSRQTAKDLNPLPHTRDDRDQCGLQDLGHGHTDSNRSPPSSPNNSQPDGPVELEVERWVSGGVVTEPHGQVLTKLVDQILAPLAPANQTIPGIQSSCTAKKRAGS